MCDHRSTLIAILCTHINFGLKSGAAMAAVATAVPMSLDTSSIASTQAIQYSRLILAVLHRDAPS